MQSSEDVLSFCTILADFYNQCYLQSTHYRREGGTKLRATFEITYTALIYMLKSKGWHVSVTGSYLMYLLDCERAENLMLQSKCKHSCFTTMLYFMITS